MNKIEQLERYIQYLKSLVPTNPEVMAQLIEEKEKEVRTLKQESSVISESVN